MAKFPIDLSRFKKISTNGKSTILTHPSGHKFIVQHSALSPEHREQLHNLPFAGGGQVKDDVPEPNKKNASAVQKGAESGGPSASEAWSNLKSGLGLAKGGEVPPKAEKKKDEVEKSQDLVDETQSPELANSLMQEPRRQYAEGGEAAPITDVDGAAPKEVIQDVEGAAPEAPAPQAETQEAAPVPAPTVDLALARKRELYNYAAAQLNPSAGGDPRKILGPNYTFGPNGEAPAQFNPASWAKATQAFQAEQVNKTSAATDAIQAATLENKARQDAGLPPLPVPQAAAGVQQATAEAPKAGQGIEAMGQKPVSQPPQQSDPYGTTAFGNAYEKGINEQKAGLTKEAEVAQSQGNEQQAALQKNQQQQQDTLNNFNTHYNNLDQERNNFIKDIRDQHIDPSHYLSSQGTASRIGTVLGLIVGGIGAGMTHTNNSALQFLNDQIDRDINAQKADLGKNENLLSANMHQFGNLRDATDMTKAMQMGIVSNQMQQAAAKASGPMAAARLLQAAGQLDQQSAPILSQIAMRKTLIQGAQSGQIPPSRVIEMIVPEHLKGEAQKQLREAQDAGALRDNTLSAFDQMAKINTLAGTLNPQTRMQVSALRDVTLDKLTKDTSGRVTPETVKLIGSIFDSKLANSKTLGVQRAQLDHLLSQGMHYPILKDYGIPVGPSLFNASGASRIPESAPITK